MKGSKKFWKISFSETSQVPGKQTGVQDKHPAAFKEDGQRICHIIILDSMRKRAIYVNLFLQFTLRLLSRTAESAMSHPVECICCVKTYTT